MIARLLQVPEQAALAAAGRYFYHILNPIIYADNVTLRNASCLFWAAKRGSLGTLERAVASGADVNARHYPDDAVAGGSGEGGAANQPADGAGSQDGDQPDGGGDREKAGRVSYTALSVAARYGHRSVAEWLLNHGADIHSPACKYCDCRYVCSHPQNVIDTHPMPGWHPLHTAMCNGSTSVCDLLVFRGANIHNVSANENIVVPALHTAAAHGLTSVIKNLTLDAGLDMHETDSFGNTALHYAALYWPDKVLCKSPYASSPIAKLLAGGAQIDTMNDDGYTPLLYACSKGNFQAALALVNAGAHPEPHWWVRGFTDVRPLYYCTRRRRRFTPTPDQETTSWEDSQIRLLCALLAAGADMEARFNRAWRTNVTPLMLASRHGLTRAVRVLCAYGAVVNAQDDKERTALHVVCESPDSSVDKDTVGEIAGILLKHGARIDVGKASTLDWMAKEWKSDRCLVPDKILACTDRANVSQSRLQDVIRSCAVGGNAVALSRLLRLEKDIFAISEREARDLIDVAIGNTQSQDTLDAILAVAQSAESTESMLWKCSRSDPRSYLLHHPPPVGRRRVGEPSPARLHAAGGCVVSKQSPSQEPVCPGRAWRASPAPSFANLETKMSIVLERNKPLALTVLNRGVSVSEVRPWCGRTYLHLACQWGNVELVEGLLERGADVNVFDRDLRTPLSIAVMEDHRDIAVLLMKEVADPHLRPADELLEEWYDGVDAAKWFQRGFMTAFDLAIQYDREDILCDMLERFCLPDIAPRSRSSYIHRACRNLSADTLELLLGRGADPNGGPACRDPPLNSLLRAMRDDPSPPDLAALLLEFVAVLILHKADANIVDCYGETAWQILDSIESYDGSNKDRRALARWVDERVRISTRAKSGQPMSIWVRAKEKDWILELPREVQVDDVCSKGKPNNNNNSSSNNNNTERTLKST